MYFLSQSGFENYASFDQKTLHENIGMSLSAVEKGIKELVENGLIIKTKHPNDARRNDYWINPMSAWKGKMSKRKNAACNLSKSVGFGCKLVRIGGFFPNIMMVSTIWPEIPN